MPAHVVETYKSIGSRRYRVLVARITSPQQVLADGAGSIHEALRDEGLAESVGLYFYRFAELERPEAFTKIGEVSREGGVIVRKQRGWLAPTSYGDSYMKHSRNGRPKVIHADVLATSKERPMYFIYYEFDVQRSFPKIDEIAAFQEHFKRFGRSTRNQERVNTFAGLGCKLIWYQDAFSEVLELCLPSGISYAKAIQPLR